MKKNHYQEGIDYADQALAVHPHLVDALLIKAYEKMGRTDLRVGVQLEFQEARRSHGEAYLKDHGYSDPSWFEDSGPATSNTPPPPAGRPWLPPLSDQSATPGTISDFSNFSTIFGKPSTLTTPATTDTLFGRGVAKPSSSGSMPIFGK